MKRSQSSLEFLYIFAMGFSLILIISGIFYTYTSSSTREIEKQQLDKIGEEMLFNVEQVYFLGNGNRVSMKLKFPEKIQNFTIHHINDNGAREPFDYMNMTYLDGDQYINTLFTASEPYIRFNCTICYHENIGGMNMISYYNASDFAGGLKNIRIESKGDWVAIDFDR